MAQFSAVSSATLPHMCLLPSNLLTSVQISQTFLTKLFVFLSATDNHVVKPDALIVFLILCFTWFPVTHFTL